MSDEQPANPFEAIFGSPEQQEKEFRARDAHRLRIRRGVGRTLEEIDRLEAELRSYRRDGASERFSLATARLEVMRILRHIARDSDKDVEENAPWEERVKNDWDREQPIQDEDRS